MGPARLMYARSGAQLRRLEDDARCPRHVHPVWRVDDCVSNVEHTARGGGGGDGSPRDPTQPIMLYARTRLGPPGLDPDAPAALPSPEPRGSGRPSACVDQAETVFP